MALVKNSFDALKKDVASSQAAETKISKKKSSSANDSQINQSNVKRVVAEYIEKFEMLLGELEEHGKFLKNSRRKDKCSKEDLIDELCSEFKNCLLSVDPNVDCFKPSPKELEMDQKIQNVQDKIEEYKIFLKSRADPCKDYDPATLEEIEKDMREIERKQMVVNWNRSLDSIMGDCVDIILHSVTKPTLERHNVIMVSFSSGQDDFWFFTDVAQIVLFDITIDGPKISFVVLTGNDPISRPFRAETQKWVLPKAVESVFRCDDHLVILYTDETVEFRDILTKKPVKSGVFREFSSAEKPLLILEHSLGKIVWCWNSDKHSIQAFMCSPNGKLLHDLPSSDKPKIFKTFDQLVVFVDDDEKVTIWKIASTVKIEVLQQHHGLAQIDDVIFDKNGSIVLYDYKNKTVVTSCCFVGHDIDKNWAIENVFKMDIEGDVSYMFLSRVEEGVTQFHVFKGTTCFISQRLR